jgi:hypothetical protein
MRNSKARDWLSAVFASAVLAMWLSACAPEERQGANSTPSPIPTTGAVTGDNQILSYTVQNSPIIVTWEVSSGTSASYDLQICKGDPQHCDLYVQFVCEKSCNVIDGESQKPRKGDFTFTSKTEKGKKKFIFQDEQDWNLEGNHYIRIRIVTEQKIGDWMRD